MMNTALLQALPIIVQSSRRPKVIRLQLPSWKPRSILTFAATAPPRDVRENDSQHGGDGEASGEKEGRESSPHPLPTRPFFTPSKAVDPRKCRVCWRDVGEYRRGPNSAPLEKCGEQVAKGC
jgi:hypothetical protein